MPTFSPAFLEDIRNRLSLSGVIGAKLRLTRAGRELKGCCPFHNEKTPSFYVNDDKQFFHCFGCGAHGDVIGFTMRFERLSFPEAIENLAAQAGMQMPRDTPVEREKYDREKQLYLLLDRATSWFEQQLFTPAGREALAYLHKRGLSDDAIRRFRLGYAPADAQALIRALVRHPRPLSGHGAGSSGDDGFSVDDLLATGLIKKSDPLRQRLSLQEPNDDSSASVARDRPDHYSFFRNRVMFPVGDKRGRIVAFGARILGEGEPKYLNSPDHVLFHKGKMLYGLSRARAALAQGQPFIVVEGYMDVIALAEAGYMGAVAPLGTALTEEQMMLLWKMLPAPENRDANGDYSPILCFDGDNAGLRAAARSVERALPLLTPAQTLRIATLTGAKDPDELIRQSGKAAFDAVLKQSQVMIDAIWTMTLAGRQMRTPEERGAFKAALKQRVMMIKDASLRELYDAEFKKRINDAFGWKPQPFIGRQKDGHGGWKNQAAPFVGTRRAPPKAQRVSERIMLALLINHPDLFDEFGENFAHLDFQNPDYDALRQRFLDYMAEPHDAPPSVDEIKRALSDREASPFDMDHSDVLNEILSNETYLHARAARPEADIAEARQAWLALCDRLEQDRIKSDYAAACALYRENPSDENQQRVEALRSQMMGFAGEAATS